MMKTKMTLFAAAAAAAALVAAPAMAKDTTKHRAHHAKVYKSKHHARMQAYERTAYQDQYNRGTGFWPADVVGGAVGAAGAIATTAVGTAGAIATAPFGGPYYRSGPYYGDAGGYPFGNHWRYGGSYASAGYYGSEWGGPVGYEYNGIAYPGSPDYDARNGFTCRPGTVTKMASGERVICQ